MVDQITRRGIKAKPPRHRRAAPRHVDLVRLGAPNAWSDDLAGIKRCRATVGSTHRGPSMALGALPPAAPLAVPSKDDDRGGNGLKPECGVRHQLNPSRDWMVFVEQTPPDLATAFEKTAAFRRQWSEILDFEPTSCTARNALISARIRTVKQIVTGAL